jgi:hypothetical protein
LRLDQREGGCTRKFVVRSFDASSMNRLR